MCTRAQKEVRELVTLMAKEVIKVVPEMKEYLVPNCERLGFCPEHNGCGRKPSRIV
jgi:thymidylate synthase ThyX